jgi:hypothetical protein
MTDHETRGGGWMSLERRWWVMTGVLLAATNVSAAPNGGQQAFTRRGALACKSLQLYKELEHDNFAAMYDYLMRASPPCTVLPNSAIATVVDRSGDYVGFTIDKSIYGGVLWARKGALRRRKQPTHGNIVVKDGDTKGTCESLSSDTQADVHWSHALATSVLNLNARTASAREPYQSAIDKNDYELVVQMNEDKCVAELDIEYLPLLGCIADSPKYHSCRYNGKDGQKAPSACPSLCTVATTVHRPSASAESASLQSAKERSDNAAKMLRARELANIPPAVRRYLERYSSKAAVPDTEAGCSEVSTVVSRDQILARMLGLAILHIYQKDEFAVISYGGLLYQEYAESTEKDMFTLNLRWMQQNCQATLNPRANTGLPIVACILRPDAVLGCLAKKSGPGLDSVLARGMCLSDTACLK